MIPKEVIDQVFEVSRIEEVVGEFVALKKRGSNLVGLCPFHNEKTGSFSVSASKGIYKCFGCGKAGNVVNFVMEHMGVNFPSAIRWLGDKYKVKIPEKELNEQEQKEWNEKESVRLMLAWAQKWYSQNEIDYFEKRGISKEMVEKWGLGYSPHKRSLANEMIKAGWLDIEPTGLFIKDEYELWDRFKGRVMFPIHDEVGRIVGFGGRLLDGKGAKYINSPEGLVYNKSKVLYGLWMAKKAIQAKGEVYLVEGYMDVISMYQGGVENVVASSGTSLTKEQARLIHRFSDRVVIVYDGDAAGVRAAHRAIEVILEEGMDVKIITLSDGHDPDSFIKEHGKDEFEGLERKNFIQYVMDVGDRKEGARLVVNLIAKCPDELYRGIYVKELEDIIGVKQKVIVREVERSKSANKFGQEQKEEVVEGFDHDYEEKELLRVMILYGGLMVESNYGLITLAEWVFFEMMRDDIGFDNPAHQAVFNSYWECVMNNVIPEQEWFLRSENSLVSGFVINNVDERKVNEEKGIKKVVQQLVFGMKERKLSGLIRGKQEALGEDEGVMDEVVHLISLKNRVSGIFSQLYK